MFPLTAYAAALAAAAPGGCPATPTVLADPGGLPSPPELRSTGGVLSVDLRARGGVTPIDGRQIDALRYNGTVPAPTLRVCAGDTLDVRFTNDLTRPTNLHTHGLHVSPRGDGDDVFRRIAPGQTARYRYELPASHAGGLSWYHPHHHGLTNEQIFRGMAGALVVESPATDDLPGLAGLPERVVVLQSAQIDGGQIVAPSDSSNDRRVVLVNGRTRPSVAIRPGELQRWRVLNASANDFVRLVLSDGQRLQVTGVDGDPLTRRTAQDAVLIGPGERRELLIRGPEAGRTVTLSTTAFEQFFTNTRAQRLVTIRGEGEPVAEPPRLPYRLAPVEDLAQARVSRRRTFTLTSTFPTFRINGRVFDHHRTDTTSRLETVEEWTVRNSSEEWHNFHLHQVPMQIVRMNGRPPARPTFRDTPAIPPRGSIVVRMRFARFDGRFVYHCHLADHEDKGMMGTIRVVRG